MNEVASQPSVDSVIAGYMALRSKKEQLKAACDEATGKLNKQMAKLEAWLQMKMHVDEVNSFSTDAGTAYKLTVERATVSDMDAFLDYVRANKAWHLLEKRVAKSGVKALLDENEPLPPGVNWQTSTSIGVRKANER